MELTIDRIIYKVEELGWSVTKYLGVVTDVYTLMKKNSFDMLLDINIVYKDTEDPNKFIGRVGNCYQDYDVSRETMRWLSEDGHGIDGAPYYIPDVYRGVEEFESVLLTLRNELENL